MRINQILIVINLTIILTIITLQTLNEHQPKTHEAILENQQVEYIQALQNTEKREKIKSILNHLKTYYIQKEYLRNIEKNLYLSDLNELQKKIHLKAFKKSELIKNIKYIHKNKSSQLYQLFLSANLALIASDDRCDLKCQDHIKSWFNSANDIQETQRFSQDAQRFLDDWLKKYPILQSQVRLKNQIDPQLIQWVFYCLISLATIFFLALIWNKIKVLVSTANHQEKDVDVQKSWAGQDDKNDKVLERKQIWRNVLIWGLSILAITIGKWISREITKSRFSERKILKKMDDEQKEKSMGRSKEQSLAVRQELSDSSNFKFILIKGGSFMMGSEEGYDYEKPVHRVEVRDFYMSKTEVTVGQYRKCVQAGVCSEPDSCSFGSPNWTDSVGDKENHPINCVDWKQARIFAKWVGGDLPSEAQWEYAARSGGREIKYPWGNAEATCQYAVMSDDGWGCGQNSTWEVCSKTGGNTVQGLCDMGGNAWEWVLDEWHNPYSGAPSDDSGWCSDRGCDGNTSVARVLRGGSWASYASNLRSANRSGSPGGRDDLVGFRVSDTVH